ncbi:energy transducer TonB [Crocinitomicaceae bacterium]|nr:energy transducer TonB [Crocinitomicaceae bacterium]
MMTYIYQNVVYPQTSIEMNEQGRVFLSFVVEKDGSITNVVVERGVSVDLDREAKRVLRKMPNWIPAKSGGKLVRFRARLPINFQLN